MTRRLVSTVRTCADVALETAWRQTPQHSVPPDRWSWPVDPTALAATVVRWPAGYNWKFRHVWGDQIRTAFEGVVRTELADVPQPHKGVVTFEVAIGGRSHRVNIEVSDYPELSEPAYEDCELHFKLQYRREGYGDRDHLLPGGFMNADPVIYRYLSRLRASRDRFDDTFDVYGRFELTMDKRRKPLEILMRSPAFRFYGGQGKVRYSRYLREITRSKVCIDLSGTASITFRLFDYFAIGACIVGPPHTCRLPIPFVDGEHVAYCKDDFSDLEEVCARYVEDEVARTRLIRNSRRFFDEHMHRDQLAAYYLHHCLARFG